MRYYIGPFILIVLFGCSKQNRFLDVKRSNSDVVPATIKDFQALLDYDQIMNRDYPMAGEIGCDNYYLEDASFASVADNIEGTAYNWQKDINLGHPAFDWNQCYQMVEYANVVLDGLSKLPHDAGSLPQASLEGSALFFRSLAFYNLTSLYCKAYSKSTANADLGIPLRISSDVNIKSKRATLEETYQRIVTDLKKAADLLPETAQYLTRPSKLAANALLAKVYLSMDDYISAGTYANAVLSKKSDLMDFNSLALVDVNSYTPFPGTISGNPEMIFYATGEYVSAFYPQYGTGYIDTTLLDSYDSSDLRRYAFYKPSVNGYIFTGTYDGFAGYTFSGIAINEVYLVRAECNARQNKVTEAMNDLNTLLSKRYTASFVPITAINADDAVSKILNERRKELPFTGNLRWEDIRRLNKDPRYAVTLKRVINGVTYTLPPNDRRCVLPIGNDEIQLSGIEQNPR